MGNQSCLILAFESLKDLPQNWRNLSKIDAYGFYKLSKSDKLPKKVTVYNQFFEIKNYNKQKKPYDYCFIRHPDPWGEPRNWLQAIAALSECLQGELKCEFWFPHEVLAFNYLLRSVFSAKSFKFIEALQVKNIRSWKNYQASWKIDHVQKNMNEFYEKNKIRILQSFYKNEGKFFDEEVDLKTVLDFLLPRVS